MKVILQKDVPDVGKKYEVKNVSDGYALNFLIPKKMALYATDALVLKATKDRATREESIRTEEAELQSQVKALHNRKILITAKAAETGGLFAGIDAGAIADALNKEFHVSLAEEHIELEKPIKQTGEYEISVSVGETKAKVVFTVVAK
ncbi:MAG: large subunit ribosomal protein L9 [Parcubacteria group bacterium Gr01-1014_48]|nr:MAG: large subunit ribosomal protein L9 [Parcubacteria group bacterium Greene0416_14]TSC74210.1 MAG: large subunit ribosomal protein L9 [Parcubacteria group bacterium Gr01-1014_48]TSD01714.1 MAG: large subunit ribosomal protein L9 [Parcubacteria group bacterium Greene1014_15]TSD08152.1 MAG: large subunit ribosomal protein L9 [Parcubacteria group bacterium Greene0714_4]